MPDNPLISFNPDKSVQLKTMRVKYASSDLLCDEDASQIFNQWKRVQLKSILRFSDNKNESRIIVYFRYFPIINYASSTSQTEVAG